MLVDFHSHILPGIDDGSSSVEESIEMLKEEARQKIKHVIATPHFYAQHDSPEHFLKKRREAELRLREAMKEYEDLPDFTVGAEVYYFSGMSESEILKDLTIGGSKYILVEMPLPPWTDQMYKELYQIRDKQGLTPIVAHVDRYIGPFRSFKIPGRLEELPVFVQANANFFLRKTTERMALRMLEKEQIHLLGSDCHDLKERKPNLGMAIKRINQKIGKDELKRIRTYENKILQSCKI